VAVLSSASVSQHLSPPGTGTCQHTFLSCEKLRILAWFIGNRYFSRLAGSIFRVKFSLPWRCMINIRTVYRKREKSPALSTLTTSLLVAVTDKRYSVVKVSLTVNLTPRAGRTDMNANQAVGLVADFSPPGSGMAHRAVQMGFLVDQLALLTDCTSNTLVFLSTFFNSTLICLSRAGRTRGTVLPLDEFLLNFIFGNF
jgi:hypothetical protein